MTARITASVKGSSVADRQSGRPAPETRRAAHQHIEQGLIVLIRPTCEAIANLAERLHRAVIGGARRVEESGERSDALTPISCHAAAAPERKLNALNAWPR